MRTFNSYNEMAVANGSAPYIPMHLREEAWTDNMGIENMSPSFKGMMCGSYAFGCHSLEFGGVGGKLEAPHVHASIGGIDKGKFWLEDERTGRVSVDPHKTKGMSQADISKCIEYIQEHLQQAFDGWDAWVKQGGNQRNMTSQELTKFNEREKKRGNQPYVPVQQPKQGKR